ncbi:MAG: hypothetical protein ACTSRA_04295 [Promethearchaeota archaeon]
MIYHFMIIDADNAILIFEKIFKPLKITESKESKNLGSIVIAKFFTAVNSFIDEIQNAMRKGRDISNMNRVILAENSSVIIHYQPEARVLIGAITDADDDPDIIIAASRKIGERFWKKYRENLERFRVTMDKRAFKAFLPDVEMILRDGKIAEIFPKLQIDRKTLHRIFLMGVITRDEYNVGSIADGKTSPLQISKKIGASMSKNHVMTILKKLENLDIIKKLQIPKL